MPLNYPWPETVSEKQRAAVEVAAQKVLSVRAEFLSPVGRASSRAAGERLAGSLAPPRTAHHLRLVRAWGKILDAVE